MFGNNTVQAIIDEWKQLDEKKCFIPKKLESLTKKRHRALKSITLVKKEKRRSKRAHCGRW